VPPTLTNALSALDSHERPILLQWATGQRFAVAEHLRASLGAALDLEVPADAFVAMDYNLDWLYAATRWHRDESVGSSKQAWPSGGELTASGEDIDLVIAWDKPSPHVLLLEAKGFTGWSNSQLASKVQRLAVIFDEETRAAIDVHFLLVGPAATRGVTTDGWPEWLLKDGRLHFQELTDPGERWAVQRLDDSGNPSRHHFTQWQLKRRRWSTAKSQTSPDQTVNSVTPPDEPGYLILPCMRCGSGPATFLVTALYAPGSAGPGRLLIYCDACRLDMSAAIWLAVPLALLNLALDEIMIALYRDGLTESEPHTAAEFLGLPAGRWLHEAVRELSRRGRNAVVLAPVDGSRRAQGDLERGQ